MEQDIIVEGFCQSVEMHGLKYKYFVGDGDSSVYARIMEKVPYGRTVLKMECANHCVRNYTGHLHTLASDKNFPLEARKLLKSVIPRLTSAARGAIRHCGEVGESAEDLCKDLRNGPRHVFGDHSECREYFCNQRDSSDIPPVLHTSGIFEQVESIVQRLVVKAPRLKENCTSNAAENYMSLVAKYNGGKRLNYSQRGSFQRRCDIAALRFQKGLAWEHSPFKRMAGKSPGSIHKTLTGRKLKRQSFARRKLCYQRRTKQKPDCSTNDGDVEYGPSADQVTNIPDCDITADELEEKCELYISSLQVSVQERDIIMEKTKMQGDCDLWHKERRKRLTASNFGIVCRRKETTSCANLVKQMLYKPPVVTSAIEYGRRNEHIAIKRFQDQSGLVVEKCGLCIDLQHGFLGASPDGIVANENAIVEVKCAPSAIQLGLEETARKKKSFFLENCEGRGLVLKTTHPYFYQVQGILNITSRDICYFVVMTDTKSSLHIEKIQRDANFWEMVMLPKLTQFYRHCLLPEIVAPNMILGKDIREPEYILAAQRKLAERQLIKPKTKHIKKSFKK